jgi:glycosyltransferase involved in cell wall biosynthesis
MLGPNEWSGIWQTRQHVGSGLARRAWPVIYSAGSLWGCQGGSQAWRERPWLGEQHVEDGVILFRSGRLQVRWPRIGWWDRYVVRRHVAALMRGVGWKRATPPIAYVCHPMFWPYVELLTGGLIVYHADDAFSLCPGWTRELARFETLLVHRADLVLAGSEAMARLLPGEGAGRARVFPNGADSGAFASAEREPCPADLARVPRPRIGYVGSINLKVNLSLVAQLASGRPDWHWVLVGPVREARAEEGSAHRPFVEGLAACRRLPNVHFLGPKPAREVARYTAHMDVNTMCYRTDPGGWWRAISPLKLHEYLAAGPPVVAADVEALRGFGAVLAIADSREEWGEAIETALTGKGPGSKDERRTIALANTWDHRIDELARWLQEAAT